MGTNIELSEGDKQDIQDSMKKAPSILWTEEELEEYRDEECRKLGWSEERIANAREMGKRNAERYAAGTCVACGLATGTSYDIHPECV